MKHLIKMVLALVVAGVWCAVEIQAQDIPVVDSWDVELTAPVDHPISIMRGETKYLRPRYLVNGSAATVTNLTSVQLWYKPSSLSTATWFYVTNGVFLGTGIVQIAWTPACESTWSEYNYNIASVAPSGASMSAAGKLTLRGTVTGSATAAPPGRVVYVRDSATYITNGGATVNGSPITNGAAISVTALPAGAIVATNSPAAGQSFFGSSGSHLGVVTGYFATASGSGDMLVSIYDPGNVQRGVLFTNDARYLAALTNASAFATPAQATNITAGIMATGNAYSASYVVTATNALRLLQENNGAYGFLRGGTAIVSRITSGLTGNQVMLVDVDPSWSGPAEGTVFYPNPGNPFTYTNFPRTFAMTRASDSISQWTLDSVGGSGIPNGQQSFVSVVRERDNTNFPCRMYPYGGTASGRATFVINGSNYFKVAYWEDVLASFDPAGSGASAALDVETNIEAQLTGYVTTNDARYLSSLTNGGATLVAGIDISLSSTSLTNGAAITISYTGGGGTGGISSATASNITASIMATGHVATATTVTGSQSNIIAVALTNAAAFDVEGASTSATNGIDGTFIASKGGLTNESDTLETVLGRGNNAAGLSATNFTDIQGTGRRAFGTGLNLANIDTTAVGAIQSGLNTGTQTIGAGARGASQIGYNTGTQTIGTNAYGASQIGYNTGTQTIGTLSSGASQIGRNSGTRTIGSVAYGASQIGNIASGAIATNNGVGAIQLHDLSVGQQALTTSDGDASILLGAGTSSNKNAIVAGDGEVSHGNGSITAGGGFYGSASGLTNFPASVVQTNDARYLAAVTNGGCTINGEPITNGAAFTITGGGGGGISNIAVAGVTGTLTGSGSNVLASVSLASLAGAGVVTNGQDSVRFGMVTSDTFQAASSAGWAIKANNGTTCISGGAGGGCNVTLADGTTVNGLLTANGGITSTGAVNVLGGGNVVTNGQVISSSTNANLAAWAGSATNANYSAYSGTASNLVGSQSNLLATALQPAATNDIDAPFLSSKGGITGGVFSVGTVVSNVAGTLYIPTNSFGGGGGSPNAVTNGGATINGNAISNGAAITLDGIVASNYVAAYVLSSSPTTTITRAMGELVWLSVTSHITKLTVDQSGWDTNGAGRFVLDLYAGTNSIGFDTTVITNSTLLDIATNTGVCTPLFFRRPAGGTIWRVRQ